MKKISILSFAFLLLNLNNVYSFSPFGHVVVCDQVALGLPNNSIIKKCMLAFPKVARWGAEGPDLPALNTMRWMSMYHYFKTGDMAKVQLQDALEPVRNGLKFDQLSKDQKLRIAWAAGWVTHIAGDFGSHGLYVEPECGYYISDPEGRSKHGELESIADTYLFYKFGLDKEVVIPYSFFSKIPTSYTDYCYNRLFSERFDYIKTEADFIKLEIEKITGLIYNIVDFLTPDDYVHLTNIAPWKNTNGLETGLLFCQNSTKKVYGDGDVPNLFGCASGYFNFAFLKKYIGGDKNWAINELKILNRQKRVDSAFDKALSFGLQFLTEAENNNYSAFSNLWNLDVGEKSFNKTTYTVKIRTFPGDAANGIGPGTSSPVFFRLENKANNNLYIDLDEELTLDFEDNETNYYHIYPNKDNFEPNMLRNFSIIKTGKKDDWHLKEVTIYADGVEVYNCSPNMWLNKCTPETPFYDISHGELNPKTNHYIDTKYEVSNGDYVIQVQNSKKNISANSFNKLVQKNNTEENKLWRITKLKNDTYTIKDLLNNKFWSIENDSKNEGANIVLLDSIKSKSIFWKFNQNKNVISIVNTFYGKSIALNAIDTMNKNELKNYDKENVSDAAFSLLPKNGMENGLQEYAIPASVFIEKLIEREYCYSIQESTNAAFDFVSNYDRKEDKPGATNWKFYLDPVATDLYCNTALFKNLYLRKGFTFKGIDTKTKDCDSCSYQIIPAKQGGINLECKINLTSKYLGIKDDRAIVYLDSIRLWGPKFANWENAIPLNRNLVEEHLDPYYVDFFQYGNHNDHDSSKFTQFILPNITAIKAEPNIAKRKAAINIQATNLAQATTKGGSSLNAISITASILKEMKLNFNKDSISQNNNPIDSSEFQIFPNLSIVSSNGYFDLDMFLTILKGKTSFPIAKCQTQIYNQQGDVNQTVGKTIATLCRQANLAISIYLKNPKANDKEIQNLANNIGSQIKEKFKDRYAKELAEEVKLYDSLNANPNLQRIFGDEEELNIFLETASNEDKEIKIKSNLEKTNNEFDELKNKFDTLNKQKDEEDDYNKKTNPDFEELKTNRLKRVRLYCQDLQIKMYKARIEALELNKLLPSDSAIKVCFELKDYRRYAKMVKFSGATFIDIMKTEEGGESYYLDENNKSENLSTNTDWDNGAKRAKEIMDKMTGAPRPIFNSSMLQFSKEEEVVINNIAKLQKKTVQELLKDLHEKNYFTWLVCNTPIPYSKLTFDDKVILEKFAKLRHTTSPILYDSLLHSKDLLLQDLDNGSEDTYKNTAIGNIIEAINPGMLTIESNNTSNSFNNLFYASINCGRYKIVSGNMTCTLSSSMDNALGKAKASGSLIINIIRPNFAKVEATYNNITEGIANMTKKEDAKKIMNTPIFLTSTANGTYEIHIDIGKTIKLTNDNSNAITGNFINGITKSANGTAVMSADEIQSIVDEPSLYDFEEIFAKKIKTNLKCNNGNPIFEISNSQTIKLGDEINIKDDPTNGAIKDMAKDISSKLKALGGEGTTTITWNFKIQKINDY